MSALPDKGWKGYGRPGHPYERQAKCRRVIHDLNRGYEIAQDEQKHVVREMAFREWIKRNAALALEVVGKMEELGMRREFGGVGR